MRGRRGGERLAAITSKAPVSRKASIGGMVRLLGRWRLLDEVVELARLGVRVAAQHEDNLAVLLILCQHERRVVVLVAQLLIDAALEQKLGHLLVTLLG